jgi:TRAP-type C4-dicarboxylate transport system permease small subunit
MEQSTRTAVVGALRRADAALFAALRLALICLMAIMTLAVLGQVVTRYLLSTSLNWSEELARLSFVCLVFLGAACLSRRNEHLAVTTLVDLLPDALRAMLLAATHGVGLYCAWFLLQGSHRALIREWAQLTPAMQVPMGVIYSTIFGAIVLLIVWLTANLVSNLLIAMPGRRA